MLAVTYFPPDLSPPHGVATARLILEPLTPAHNALDYAAVTESREQLRLWSGGPWPSEEFTPEENLQDLRWHWREHRARLAFTFTVQEPARRTCLGCVYLRPLAELVPDNRRQLRHVRADESLVRFWIRTSRLSGDLEAHLLQTLVAWLKQEWPFSRILLETRTANERQAFLFASFPLPHVLTLQMPRRGGAHHFYQV